MEIVTAKPGGECMPLEAEFEALFGHHKSTRLVLEVYVT
jgi:hypothetical protein